MPRYTVNLELIMGAEVSGVEANSPAAAERKVLENTAYLFAEVDIGVDDRLIMEAIELEAKATLDPEEADDA